MFKTTKESCFFYALILVAITLPFPNLLVNTLSIWLMIATWVISSPIKKKIVLLRTNRLIWLFASLFIIYCFGLIYGDFKLGLFEIEKRLSLLIFPVILGTAPPISSKKIKVILVSFALSSIVTSLICLIDSLYSNYKQGIPYSNARFYFSNLTVNYGFHASYFSIYLVFSIFILVYIGLQNKSLSKFAKLAIAAAIIYSIFFIFLLASRIGLISLVMLTVSALVYYSHKKRKLFYGIAVALIFSGSILFSLQFFTDLNLKFKGLIHLDTENSEYSGSSIRLDLWENTMIIINDNLLFGVGTGDLQPALQNIFKTKEFTQPYQNFLNPHNKNQLNSHNQFLDITATLGMFGLLIFLGCLFYPLYLASKNKNYLFALFIFLFMFLCSVEVPFAVQKGVVWFAFFNALFAFHSFRHSINDESIDVIKN